MTVVGYGLETYNNADYIQDKRVMMTPHKGLKYLGLSDDFAYIKFLAEDHIKLFGTYNVGTELIAVHTLTLENIRVRIISQINSTEWKVKIRRIGAGKYNYSATNVAVADKFGFSLGGYFVIVADHIDKVNTFNYNNLVSSTNGQDYISYPWVNARNHITAGRIGLGEAFTDCYNLEINEKYISFSPSQRTDSVYYIVLWWGGRDLIDAMNGLNTVLVNGVDPVEFNADPNNRMIHVIETVDEVVDYPYYKGADVDNKLVLPVVEVSNLLTGITTGFDSGETYLNYEVKSSGYRESLDVRDTVETLINDAGMQGLFGVRGQTVHDQYKDMYRRASLWYEGGYDYQNKLEGLERFVKDLLNLDDQTLGGLGTGLWNYIGESLDIGHSYFIAFTLDEQVIPAPGAFYEFSQSQMFLRYMLWTLLNPHENIDMLATVPPTRADHIANNYEYRVGEKYWRTLLAEGKNINSDLMQTLEAVLMVFDQNYLGRGYNDYNYRENGVKIPLENLAQVEMEKRGIYPPWTSIGGNDYHGERVTNILRETLVKNWPLKTPLAGDTINALIVEKVDEIVSEPDIYENVEVKKFSNFKPTGQADLKTESTQSYVIMKGSGGMLNMFSVTWAAPPYIPLTNSSKGDKLESYIVMDGSQEKVLSAQSYVIMESQDTKILETDAYAILSI